ncbi:MAG: WD repeat-containing protein [Amphiamblys sp. WSBS2006]|nr:MAG: WD repeat-containing protein [Amphiamblys sp. WSBS2006]
MRFDFGLRRKLGCVYSGGNVLFVESGKHFLAPAGPHVVSVDVQSATMDVLPLEHRRDAVFLAASPDSTLLLSFDADGNSVLTSLGKKTVLAKISFNSPVRHARFSPDGKYIAVAADSSLTLWLSPGTEKKSAAPLARCRKLSQTVRNVTQIDWSSDSKYILVSSSDMAAYVFAAETEHFLALTSHRGSCLGSWFAEKDAKIYTVSRAGDLHVWGFCPETCTVSEKPERKKLAQEEKDFVVHCSYACGIIAAAFESGRLLVVEAKTSCRLLSLSMEKMDTFTLTPDAEWIGFASKATGRLAIFAWKTETLVLEQNGHAEPVSETALSGDSALVATGDASGRVLLWNADTGMGVAVFEEEADSVVSLKFAPQNRTLFAAYGNGAVCAFDLVKMKCFRKLASPDGEKITALAVDRFGELVATALLGSYRIALWSVQTAALLDVFETHSAPVSSLCFEPTRANFLLSGSWDCSACIHDLFSRKPTTQTLPHSAKVTAVCYSPNGSDVATATLDGSLNFWCGGQPALSVSCRSDVGEEIFFEEKAASSHFSSIGYTPDGLFIGCTGKTPFVCFYDAESGRLHRKFKIEAVQSVHHTKRNLPRRDYVTRSIAISSDSHRWAVSAVDGMLVYALDETSFSPVGAGVEATPAGIEREIDAGNLLEALGAALRLNQKKLAMAVLLRIPKHKRPEIVAAFSAQPLLLVDMLVRLLETEEHVGLLLSWASAALLQNERHIRKHTRNFAVSTKKLSAILSAVYGELDSVVSGTLGTLDCLLDTQWTTAK